MATRWTSQHDEQLTELNKQGVSLTAASKIMGFSPAQLSAKAKNLGLSWDTSNVASANKARHDRLKDERLTLQERAAAAASGVYDTIEAADYQRIFKGERGVEEVRTIQFMPPAERRDLAASATQHVAVMIRLAAIDDAQGVDVATSMLGRLAMDIGGELAADIRTKIELNAGLHDG